MQPAGPDMLSGLSPWLTAEGAVEKTQEPASTRVWMRSVSQEPLTAVTHEPTCRRSDVRRCQRSRGASFRRERRGLALGRSAHTPTHAAGRVIVDAGGRTRASAGDGARSCRVEDDGFVCRRAPVGPPEGTAPPATSTASTRADRRQDLNSVASRQRSKNAPRVRFRIR